MNGPGFLTAEDLMALIQKIVRYNWDAEVRDWLLCQEEEGNENDVLPALYQLARFTGMDALVAEFEALPRTPEGLSS